MWRSGWELARHSACDCWGTPSTVVGYDEFDWGLYVSRTYIMHAVSYPCDDTLCISISTTAHFDAEPSPSARGYKPMEVWPGLPSRMPADREMVWQRHALSRERLEAESFSTSMCFGCRCVLGVDMFWVLRLLEGMWGCYVCP